jgi:hypothetical protein
MCEAGGLARIKVGGKYSYIDKSGKAVIKPQFDDHYSEGFSEGLVSIKVNEKWGFINKQVDFVIKPQYDYVGNFSGELAPA